MKHIVILFSIILSSLAGFSQSNNPNAPIFKFETETHDFGNIKEGTDFTYDFVFTNIGKEPLVISNCSASCGCTTPNWSKDPILPGQKGKISVKYDTRKKSGTFSKTVYIASNAKSDRERYEITIKGNVVE